ncbi:MAG: trypsin-like peptidase domain-containing protein [Planctomycetota bacterium]
MLFSVLLALVATCPAAKAEVAEIRLTPIVRAVRDAAPSVVNIQGQKTVADNKPGVGDSTRQVNGMGTGVVIDPRGYILTNHHVIDGVRQINVTLSDRRTYTAHKVAHDKRTDLAVIKIRTGRPLECINVGTSSDLLTGETVVAVGNAFGYEHTVTQGIISALHRDVQVSDTQSYDDLIQTDASINPGNSGGPLLSIEGRMIGVNVAVRAGAQGIGFAIPVDKAMRIAAAMMSIERLENKWHGLQTVGDNAGEPRLVVSRVTKGSPAQQSGLQPGDVISRIDGRQATRPLDLELALLGRRTGEAIDVEVIRKDEPLDLTLAVAPRGRVVTPRVASSTASKKSAVAPSPTKVAQPTSPRSWQVLGLALQPEPKAKFSDMKYRGGMRVTKVRDGSVADRQGIRRGDILVGMHRWETASEQDIRYIVNLPDLAKMGPLKFYILRGEETLYGHLNVASTATRRR